MERAVSAPQVDREQADGSDDKEDADGDDTNDAGGEPFPRGGPGGSRYPGVGGGVDIRGLSKPRGANSDRCGVGMRNDGRVHLCNNGRADLGNDDCCSIGLANSDDGGPGIVRENAGSGVAVDGRYGYLPGDNDGIAARVGG